MAVTPTTPQKRKPYIGKDELNLADWRISVPTHQQPRKEDGGKLDVIITMFHDIQQANWHTRNGIGYVNQSYLEAAHLLAHI